MNTDNEINLNPSSQEQMMDILNQFNQQYEKFEDYILQCFEWYKKLYDQSWRKEFEDVHSIEFFSTGFINIRCGLNVDHGYNNENRSELPEEIKQQITDYYYSMIKCLLLTEDLDNIYLVKRIVSMGIPGFYSDEKVRESKRESLEQIYNEVCKKPAVQQAALTYKVKDKK